MLQQCGTMGTLISNPTICFPLKSRWLVNEGKKESCQRALFFFQTCIFLDYRAGKPGEVAAATFIKSASHVLHSLCCSGNSEAAAQSRRRAFSLDRGRFPPSSLPPPSCVLFKFLARQKFPKHAKNCRFLSLFTLQPSVHFSLFWCGIYWMGNCLFGEFSPLFFLFSSHFLSSFPPLRSSLSLFLPPFSLSLPLCLCSGLHRGKQANKKIQRLP